MTDDRSTNFVRSVERLRDAAINAEHATAHDAFSVCIHRGTQQIGGTCIELSCQGKHMLLDLGLPLDFGETDPVTLLPPIPGLHTPDPRLSGWCSRMAMPTIGAWRRMPQPPCRS